MCEVLDVTPLLQALVDHLVRLESLPPDRAGRRLASVLSDQIDAARRVELRLPAPQHPRAIRVADLLMSDPSDTVTLAALGSTFAISPRTLARQFISDTGLTLGQWRRQFRLTHALTLVASGRPVKDVALEVGYESASAFVAAFKRALGTTPARLFRR
jgi:AraC-like DNA-binding protein